VQRVGLQRQLQGGLRLGRAALGPGPVAQPDQHFPVQRVQLVAGTVGPGLVAVGGQQLPAVRRLGRPQRGQLAAVQRGRGRRTEGRGVDVDQPAGPQHDHLVPQLQQAVGALPGERPPGRVQDLVQVVGGRGRREIRPEQVEQIFAVQPLGRVQRQQLDHRLRLAQPPARGVDRTAADLDGESSEQLYPHLHAPGAEPSADPGYRSGSLLASRSSRRSAGSGSFRRSPLLHRA
jgi:hypothetical protein